MAGGMPDLRLPSQRYQITLLCDRCTRVCVCVCVDELPNVARCWKARLLGIEPATCRSQASAYNHYATRATRISNRITEVVGIISIVIRIAASAY